MNPFGRFNPANYSASNPFNLDVGLGWQYIRVINNSPYLLSVSFGGMGTADFPEMFLEDILITNTFNGKITIIPIANFSATTIASALSTLVSINAYGVGEIKSPQAQPLTTISAVGNSVPLSATATSVANDGNASGTQFVEATPTGASASTVSIKNDGTSLFSGLMALNKALGGATQEFLHFAPSDQATFQWGFDIDTAGNLLIVDQNSGHIEVTIEPGTPTGLKLSNTGNIIEGWSFFSGNASGNYNHGLGLTPNVVLLNASAVGSETLGWDTPTGTQVHITNGDGVAWTALALRMG